MEVMNLSWNEHLINRHNSLLLPKSIRGIVVGKSGCGKSNLMFNLLLRDGFLDYNSLKVFGKSLFQPEYKIIKSAFEQNVPKDHIVQLFTMKDELQAKGVDPVTVLHSISSDLPYKSDIQCEFFENANQVPDPKDLDPSPKNLIIFDDLQLEKHSTCEKYYVRGRHSNVDCFYLAQNYFKLPRQNIRENANFICLFKQDAKNVNHLYQDHVGDDMTKQEFKAFCKKVWSMPHGFITIDLSSGMYSGKYRCMLDTFYIPD